MRDRSPHVLDAPIGTPAIRLSLGKLRPRRASVCFIEHSNNNNKQPENNRLDTGVMPQKIPGVGGLAPASIYNRISTKTNLFFIYHLNQVKTVALPQIVGG